jgi:hypothetical protein
VILCSYSRHCCCRSRRGQPCRHGAPRTSACCGVSHRRNSALGHLHGNDSGREWLGCLRQGIPERLTPSFVARRCAQTPGVLRPCSESRPGGHTHPSPAAYTQLTSADMHTAPRDIARRLSVDKAAKLPRSPPVWSTTGLWQDTCPCLSSRVLLASGVYKWASLLCWAQPGAWYPELLCVSPGLCSSERISYLPFPLELVLSSFHFEVQNYLRRNNKPINSYYTMQSWKNYRQFSDSKRQ